MRSWMEREQAILTEISELVHVTREQQAQYDSIDMLIDLLASIVIPAIEEYFEEEYDASFRSSLDGWLTLDPDMTARSDAVHAETAGKPFDARIREYLSDGLDELEPKLARLIASDGHRVRSAGTLDAGNSLQSAGLTVTKTWRGVMDERERDPHIRLEGVTVPYHSKFEIDGFTAPAPGLFGVAELDCNCRCQLELGVTIEK